MNRQHVIDTFQNYVEKYDLNDTKINLKVEHTYHVAELSETIARSLNLNEQDINLAWLIGMLHDIGRFEQLRRYGTFIDSESIDHALLGVEILFGTSATAKDHAAAAGDIREFLDESDEAAIIREAVRQHSAYKLPTDLDERTRQFCDIIRDADKIDIFRVNVDIPLEEIYNLPLEEFYTSEVTPEVFEAFKEGDTVLRSLKKTAIDYLVGHISLVNGLVYPVSHAIVKEQGYLDQMLSFPTRNPQAAEVLREMREVLG